MDSTSLSVDALTSLVEESAKFWESEAWYNEVGLPFRKGFLLHGPSGSGKRECHTQHTSPILIPFCYLRIGDAVYTVVINKS